MTHSREEGGSCGAQGTGAGEQQRGMQQGGASGLQRQKCRWTTAWQALMCTWDVPGAEAVVWVEPDVQDQGLQRTQRAAAAAAPAAQTVLVSASNAAGGLHHCQAASQAHHECSLVSNSVFQVLFAAIGPEMQSE